MKRCIKCKQTKEISSFENKKVYTKFCEECWKSNTNEELNRYENNFNFDYFCQKYPDALEDNSFYKENHEIDYSTFIQEQEEKLETMKKIKVRREELGIELTELERQDLLKDVAQLEQQLTELKTDQLQANQLITQIQIKPKYYENL